MKSSPWGKLTSNIGATRAATDSTDVIKSDMRSRVFSNRGSLSGLAYRARGFHCTRLRLEFRGNTPSRGRQQKCQPAGETASLLTTNVTGGSIRDLSAS